jgi:hypothetical protein
MTVESPMSEAYLKEILREILARKSPNLSATCGALIRQMMVAGRSRHDARKLLRSAIHAVKQELNSH